MNLLDILTTSPHFYGKDVWAINKNLNFDLSIERVNREMLLCDVLNVIFNGGSLT